MHNLILLSHQLPAIGLPTKSIVNMGTWFLYEISSKDSQARYLLKTSKEAFFLNEQGEKISLVQDKEPYQIKNIVYFSDLPKPPSVQDNYAI